MNSSFPRLPILVAALVACAALSGCGGIDALQDGAEVFQQANRMHRIANAVGGQSCQVSIQLMDRRDRERLRAFHAGELEPGAAVASCMQAASNGERVVLQIADGKVRCPIHGVPGEGPPPLETVRDDIEERQDELDARGIETLLWGGAFLALLAAGFWYLRGGAAADIAAALARTEPGSTAGATEGYRCVVGRAACDEPLIAPRYREPVAAYRYLQVEEWEQKDRNGHWVPHRTEHKDEVVLACFRVEDAAGAIEVAAGGARFEGRKLHEETVPAGGAAGDAPAAPPPRVPGVPLPGPAAVGGVVNHLVSSSFKRNHRYVHTILGIEPGDEVLVLGWVAPGEGGPPRFQAAPGTDAEEHPYLVAAGSHPDVLRRFREDGVAGRLLMGGFLALAAFLAAAAMLVAASLPPA